MDSVRFGRALGIGARAAAKTLVTAVDAATSPNPAAVAKGKQGSGEDGASTSAAGASASSASASGKAQASGADVRGARLGQQAARTTAQVRQTGKGLKEGSRRFGEAVWGPFVKLSGALWLELTGVFFGIFALFAAGGAWKIRAALHTTTANQHEHGRFMVAVLMAALFGYFCISSFLKANRRSRRP